MKKENQRAGSGYLTDYRFLVEKDGIWTKAFQRAVDEHEVIKITAGEYLIDDTIILPSNCHIIAEEGAMIKKTPKMNVLMLRNALTKDGSRMPVIDGEKNQNISITGGIWTESVDGKNWRCGLYDRNGNFHGVSAGMFFNHVENLSIKDVTIAKIGGYGIQVSHLNGGHFENITFEGTAADGLHMNGFSENIRVKNVKGCVGDDLVALNAYDWPQSSVAFGPIRNVLCEDLEVFEESSYKALRILPGKYFYEDGTVSDCSIREVVFRNVKGIQTCKFYFQTPCYPIHGTPKSGEPGNCGNIRFENVEINLTEPVDKLPEYMESHPVKGSIAAFELGSNIEKLTFKNVKVTLDREKYPRSYFMCIGPKSVRSGEYEVFDPYISSTAKEVVLENVTVNGTMIRKTNRQEWIHEIVFDDIYQEGDPTTSGKIEKIDFAEESTS